MSGTRIEQLRRIADNHQAGLVDGCFIDVQTAGACIAVWDALRPDLHPKFERLSMPRLAQFAWEQVGKASRSTA